MDQFKIGVIFNWQWKYFAVFLLICVIPNCSAYFENCDNTFNLNPGVTYLQSPYYPQYYNLYGESSCIYTLNAPLDYEIQFDCSIELNKASNTACSSEYFYVATDGDKQLRGAEQLCGVGNITRKSVFRRGVLAYISGGSWGRFQCKLTVTAQACDCGWSVNTKIVNGQEAQINEYPSMVALMDTTKSTSQPFCGAAIVARRYILTAAHCTRQVQNSASRILAIVGDHDRTTAIETKHTAQYYIDAVIEHPSYVANPSQHDLALLRTQFNMEWSRGVGPVCLPPSNVDFTYQSVDTMGWGTTTFAGIPSDKLLKVSLQILDNNSCANSYAGFANIYGNHICTYDNTGTSKDTCQYDSGGPVIYRGLRQFLVGCISFGKPCGQGGYAVGVNTRITSYITWIDQVTQNSRCIKSL